jgi:hypothetical protein
VGAVPGDDGGAGVGEAGVQGKGVGEGDDDQGEGDGVGDAGGVGVEGVGEDDGVGEGVGVEDVTAAVAEAAESALDPREHPVRAAAMNAAAIEVLLSTTPSLFSGK